MSFSYLCPLHCLSLLLLLLWFFFVFLLYRHKLFRISSSFPEQRGQSYSNSAQSIFSVTVLTISPEKLNLESNPGYGMFKFVQIMVQKLVWKHPQCRFKFVQIINPVDKVGRQWGSKFYIRIY